MARLKNRPFCGYESIGCTAKHGGYGLYLFIKCELCGAESKKIGLGASYNAPEDDDEFWRDRKVKAVRIQLENLWNTRAEGNGGDE